METKHNKKLVVVGVVLYRGGGVGEARKAVMMLGLYKARAATASGSSYTRSRNTVRFIWELFAGINSTPLHAQGSQVELCIEPVTLRLAQRATDG